MRRCKAASAARRAGRPRETAAGLGPRSGSWRPDGDDGSSVFSFFPMSEMCARTVVIRNPQGLHARPADLFVRQANQFVASVEIIKDGERVCGKSILSVLTLGAGPGTELRIEACGPDAQAALDALASLVESGFEEAEAEAEEGEHGADGVPGEGVDD